MALLKSTDIAVAIDGHIIYGCFEPVVVSSREVSSSSLYPASSTGTIQFTLKNKRQSMKSPKTKAKQLLIDTLSKSATFPVRNNTIASAIKQFNWANDIPTGSIHAQ